MAARTSPRITGRSPATTLMTPKAPKAPQMADPSHNMPVPHASGRDSFTHIERACQPRRASRRPGQTNLSRPEPR